MVCHREEDRAEMAERRVKAGILGIDGCGAALLEALRSCGSIELIALADRNRDLAKERAAELRVEAYDDYRSLIVEQPLDALFVSAPPFACHDQLKLAATKGIHVWRETPLARSVHESTVLLQAFESHGVRLAVARRWQFIAGPGSLSDVEEWVGQPYVARGVALEHRADPLGWRGDSERAGGGVLIDRAYELVDAIVQKMRLPDEVQATTTRRSRAQPYDTEDVASVTLRYQNGSMATLLAHRRTWPPTWSLTFDGPKGSLVLEPPDLVVRAPDGKAVVQKRSADPYPYDAQISAFAEALLTEADDKPIPCPSPAAEHLAPVAVIETAYLSARTGEPESPAQLYHLHDLPLPARARTDEQHDEAQAE
jgi:predicted dehydrogenase